MLTVAETDAIRANAAHTLIRFVYLEEPREREKELLDAFWAFRMKYALTIHKTRIKAHDAYWQEVADYWVSIVGCRPMRVDGYRVIYPHLADDPFVGRFHQPMRDAQYGPEIG